MKALREKITEARRVMDLVLEHYQNPAVMWSGGKDSMVLLHLLREWGVKCAVIFLRDPFFPRKNEFQERMAREWELEIYDWAPASMALQVASATATGETVLETVATYQMGPGTCRLPKNLYEPTSWEGRWACALKDLLLRPRGSMEFPWDVLFHGHKSSDVDPLMGAVPLSVDIAHGPPATAYPLRHWTDDDVWAYTEAETVPQQTTRYNVETGEENPDKTENLDYLACCTRCVDRRNGPSVFCPRLKLQVSNVSAQVAYVEPARPAYIAKE